MRAGPSSTKESRNSAAGDTNPSGGMSNGMAEPESVAAIDPDLDEWYKNFCRNTYGQEEMSAQGNPVTNGQNYSCAGDNSNPSGGLNTEIIESDYSTVPGGDRCFQKTSRVPLAQRLGGQYVLGAYNPQINYQQQPQPARTPSWPVQYTQPDSQLFQSPLSLLWVDNKASGWRAPPKTPSSSRIKRISRKSTPGRRGGRSIPPAATDPRWNIWTLGNLDIRHINGGVTTKHLQKALYNTDGRRRAKLGHDSLVDQVLSKRDEMRSSMPEGWNSTQGWWVHINPGS